MPRGFNAAERLRIESSPTKFGDASRKPPFAATAQIIPYASRSAASGLLSSPQFRTVLTLFAFPRGGPDFGSAAKSPAFSIWNPMSEWLGSRLPPCASSTRLAIASTAWSLNGTRFTTILPPRAGTEIVAHCTQHTRAGALSSAQLPAPHEYSLRGALQVSAVF